MTRHSLTRVGVALAIPLVALGFLVAPASGGDNVAIYSFDPDEGETTAGETIEVDVVFSSHGGYDGSGVVALAATVAYDADRLSVVDVDLGSWFGDGDSEVDGTTAVDEEAGEVSIEQTLESSEDGATNSAPVATITFAVDENADSGVADLEFASSSAATSEYPQNTIDRSGEIDISSSDTETDDESVPGFGAVAALVAVFLTTALVLRLSTGN